MLALDNIQRAQCQGKRPCVPATADEKSTPPLTVAEAQAIVARGVLSGLAEYCGLDWLRQNFQPMMGYWRESQKKNERQMALVALMHGIIQGQTKQAMTSRGGCTDRERETLTARLPFRP